MNLVPKVSVRKDMRFSLEENWQVVQNAIGEVQKRGIIVTPLSVFYQGELIGWYLEGWKPPPPIILYKAPELIEEFSDYNI